MNPNIKKVLVVLLITCIFITSAISPIFATTYTDTKTHWAKDRIDKWTSLGIFAGSNNKFRPNDYITRGELAIVLNNIMKYQEKAENTFTDLDNKYYTEALLKANCAGIINGSNKKIRPKDKATREEAAVMIVKAFSIKSNRQNDYLKFKDSSQISSWAIASVNAISDNGYVNGDKQKKFNPKSNITRAEILTIIDNCIKYLYSEEGTYKENTINGNVVVNSPNINLKDSKINGNLIIAPGAREGNIHLENMEITGDIIAKGGANLFVNNSKVSGNILINKVNGKLTLKVDGTSYVEKILLESGASIDSSALKTGALECVEISSVVPKNHSIVLNGNFKLVINNAKDMLIEAKGSIDNLFLNQKTVVKGGANIKSVTTAEGADSVINGIFVPGGKTNFSFAKQPSQVKVYYTVTFQSNGGSPVQTVSVLSGQTLILPVSPTYAGYIFMGWYTDKELTIEYNPNTAITSNITLYAKWNGWKKPVILDGRFEEGYPKFTVTPDKKIKLIVKLKDASDINPVDVFMLVNQMNPLFDATSEEVIHGHCGAADGLVEVDEAPYIQISDTNEHEIETQVTVKGINNIKMYFVLKSKNGTISQEPVVIEFLSADVLQQDKTAPELYSNGIYINKTYDKITLYFDEAVNVVSIPTSAAITITNNISSPSAITINGINLKNIDSNKGVMELYVNGISDTTNLSISYIKPLDGAVLQDNAAVPNQVESFLNMPVKNISYSVSADNVAVSNQGKYIYISTDFALLDFNSFDFQISKGPDQQHLTPINTDSDVLRIWSNSGDYHKMYICLDNTPSLSAGDKYYITLIPAPKAGTTATDFSGDNVTSVINLEVTPITIQEVSIVPDTISYSSTSNSITVTFLQMNNLFTDGGMSACLFTLNVDGKAYVLRGKLFLINGQIVIDQKNVPVSLSTIDWSKATLTYSPSIHNYFDSDTQMTYKSGMPYGGFANMPVISIP